MPIIRVEMFSGRTPEQKEALVNELTNAFVKTAGGSPSSVQVILSDIETNNWSRDGKLFSKQEL